MTTIIVTHEDNEVDEFEFGSGHEVITIGRRSTNDVAIPNLSISGNHAKITFEDGKAWLEDLNSTNGTYVNGEVVLRHALVSGDDIILGKIRMGVVIPEVSRVAALASDYDDFDSSDMSVDTLGSIDSSLDLPGMEMRDDSLEINDDSLEMRDKPIDHIPEDELSFDEDARLFAQPPVETPKTNKRIDTVADDKLNGHVEDHKAHPLDGIERRTLSAVMSHDDTAPPMHELDNAPVSSNGAVIEIKNGAKSGQILPIDKPVTTLGRPGIQIAAIMRKPDGYFLMHIESDDSVDRPTLNRDVIGDEPVLLHSGDELNVAGIDVEFMLS
ncbi:MAG: FHA domain-containing protein [Granulosicoccus sp.]